MRWFRSRRLAVWYHPAFRLPIGGMANATGLDARRADNVLTWLLDMRLAKDKRVFEAPEASYDDLRRVHDDDWLLGLDDRETVAHVLGADIDVPVESVVEVWRRGTGAAIEAARWVADNDGLAATLMGGFHHAGPARGAGFCGLSDIAVAIAVRRKEGLAGDVLIIDLDAHPPDGLAEFALPGVHIRSVSADSGWRSGGGMDLRVRMGAGDEEYLTAVDRLLADLPEADLVFYLAGSDPADDDRLGGLAVTPKGLRQRDKRVFAAIEGVPTVVVPGGGYGPRSWAIYAATIAEGVGSSAIVDRDYDPVTRRVGRVARTFTPFEGELEITEADLGMAFGLGGEGRFLDHYTRHGIEYALTRYGILDALRRMGFSDIQVDVEAARMPHRLRVSGRWAGGTGRLIELSLAFRTVDRWRTLFIEWLEMVDPRRSLEAGSPLPGQAHPGLGMAREIAAILQVAAERLHLDGISFVPSHYHVAWMARSRGVLVDPAQRGRFRALRTWLSEVPLGDASARLTQGIPTEDGELLRWEPGLMVRAINPELRDHLRGVEPEARAVEQGTLLRLLPVDAVFHR